MMLRVAICAAGVLGLLLGWYLSTAMLEKALRITYLPHRSLAALAGAVSLGLAVHLWKGRKMPCRAVAVLLLGLAAIAAVGFWMSL